MTYRSLWKHTWCVVATLGVGTTSLMWSPLKTAAAVGLSTFFAGVLIAMARRLGGIPALAALRTRRELAGHALLIGSAVLLAVVATGISPLLTLAVALALCGSSPWLVDRVLRRRRPKPTVVPALPTLETHHAVQRWVRSMSDRELCRKWRQTFWDLGIARHPSEVAHVVAVRQLVLDELDRRDPVAVRVWLASDARAANGPDRYFPRDEPQTGSSDAA